MLCLCSTFASATWNRPLNTWGKIHLTLTLTPSFIFPVEDAHDEVISIIQMCQLCTHTPLAWYKTFCNVIFCWFIQQEKEGGGEKTTKVSHCQKNYSWISTFRSLHGFEVPFECKIFVSGYCCNLSEPRGARLHLSLWCTVMLERLQKKKRKKKNLHIN